MSTQTPPQPSGFFYKASLGVMITLLVIVITLLVIVVSVVGGIALAKTPALVLGVLVLFSTKKSGFWAGLILGALCYHLMIG